MHRRSDFSFPGSPSPAPRGLPPRAPSTHPMSAADDEEVRWLQASLQASPETNYYSSGGSGSPGSGSGTPSPQLWTQSQSQSNHHQQLLLHRQYPASAGSSPSRAQAIAGYRREMLDLVRGLPESAYELSLRDIVEHPHRQYTPSSASSPTREHPSLPIAPGSTTTVAGRHHLSRGAVPGPVTAGAREEKKDEHTAVVAEDVAVSRGKQEKQGRSKQRTTVTMRKQRSRSMERSVSLDTGLLIKLFLPLSIGAGRKKKVSVSPKPDDGNKKQKKRREKKRKQGKQMKEEAVLPPAAAAAAAAPEEEEWWTKSEFSEAGSSSRTSSTGSSNSNSSSAAAAGVRNAGANPRAPARSWSRKRTGCYAFFRANKGKNGVNQD